MAAKRDKYTGIEQRKMLKFIASELRVYNPHARRKGPRVWQDYVKQHPNTTKTPVGLESHFRKMILPRLANYCKDIASDDFFILMRVFKTHLTPAQQQLISASLKCELKFDELGFFVGAVLNDDDERTVRPSEAMIARIFQHDILDDTLVELEPKTTPTKRLPYRAVEERKMLAFIASELRVHNLHARRKGPRVWHDYVRLYPNTTKAPAGLESHFRKMILPRLANYCKDIASDDLFILMRVFKTHLTPAQQTLISASLNCELKVDEHGVFVSAVLNDDDERAVRPAEEMIAQIFQHDILEDTLVEPEGEKTKENDPGCRAAEPTKREESSIKYRLRHVVENQTPSTSSASVVQANHAPICVTPHKMRKDALIIRRRLTDLLGAELVSAADQRAGKIADVFTGSFVENDERLLKGAVHGLKWLLT